ncbi:uncharacterized protein TM35_000171150, partial [Trypanosoma theileri]
DQHTREVEQLQTELRIATERAERAERAVTDSASSAEKRHREELSQLEESLAQQKQHGVDLASLRNKLKAESDRVAKLEESKEELSRQHREEMNSLKGKHAKERDRLVKKVAALQKALDSAKNEAESIRNQISLHESCGHNSFSESDRRVRATPDKFNSEVESSEVRQLLIGEVYLLRARCSLMEEVASSATERSQEIAAMVVKLAQQLGEAKARLAMCDSSFNAGAGAGVVDTLGLHISLDTLRGVVLEDLRSTMPRTVLEDEETQSVLSVARSLITAIKRASSLSVRATDRHMELGRLLNLTAAQQTVALKKIHDCLSDSVSLQKNDGAMLEASLLLFGDVTTELEGVLGVEKDFDAAVPAAVPDTNAVTPLGQFVSQTQTRDGRDVFVEGTLRRAQQRIHDGSTPLRCSSSSCGGVVGATPNLRLQRTPPALHPSNNLMSPASFSGGRTVTPPSGMPSSNRYITTPVRRPKGNRSFGADDEFERAKKYFVEEEKLNMRQQQRPVTSKQWVTPGKTSVSSQYRPWYLK